MAEPVLVALLFADRVIVEHKNMKKTIVGTFTRFHSENFPIMFPPWYIYAAVTNLEGDHTFSVNLVLEKEQQVVIGINGQLNTENRKQVSELIFPINKAIFPSAADYVLTFNIDGQQTGSRILEVMEQSRTSGGKQS